MIAGASCHELNHTIERVSFWSNQVAQVGIAGYQIGNSSNGLAGLNRPIADIDGKERDGLRLNSPVTFVAFSLDFFIFLGR
jgi:hypothetical protein